MTRHAFSISIIAMIRLAGGHARHFGFSQGLRATLVTLGALRARKASEVIPRRGRRWSAQNFSDKVIRCQGRAMPRWYRPRRRNARTRAITSPGTPHHGRPPR